MSRRDKLLRFLVTISVVGSFSYRKFVQSLGRQHLPGLRDIRRRYATRADQKPEQCAAAQAPPVQPDCAAAARHQSAWLARADRVYRYTFLAYFVMLASKNLLLCLLDLDYFARFRYLDCYLVGRLILDGHFSGAAKYLAVLFSSFQLIWIYCIDFGKSKFCFEALDFLASDYSLVFEVEAKTSRLAAEQNAAGARYLDRFVHPQHQEGCVWQSIADHPAFFYANPLDRTAAAAAAGSAIAPSHADTDDQAPPLGLFRLRPNRTTRAWRALAKFTLIYFLVGALVLLVYGPAFVYVLAPFVTTRLGHELNYAHCADYVAGRPEAAERGLYVPTKPAEQLARERARPPFLLPLDDFKPLTVYNAAASLADLTDNLFFWSATGCSFLFDTYIVLVIVLDASLYLDQVERSVSRLRCQWEAQSAGGLERQWRAHRRGAAGGALSSCTTSSNAARQLETCHSQAMVLDFFGLIQRYEPFVHNYLLFCIALWLAFTITICAAILSPTSTMSLALLEIYSLEAFACVYFSSIVGYFAYLRGRIKRLYNQMATIVALDKSGLAGRASAAAGDPLALIKSHDRWTVLMQYFYPHPLYCFSIFHTIEINWFFSMKLVSWICSAVLVASSLDHIFETTNSAAGPTTLASARRARPDSRN